MNTLLKIAIALCFTLAANAQDFSKYESQEGVTSIKINKTMFKLMGKLNLDPEEKEAKEMIDMIKNLDGIQILTTSNESHKKSMLSDVKKHVSTKQLDELMIINDGGKTVEFYIKDKANSDLVEQLFMFINDVDEAIVIMINGSIDMSRIGGLMSEFNLPGASELSKVN